MGSDLMSRRLTMGANSVMIAKGSVIGDDTNILSFPVSFEPDVVIITSDLDTSEAGWAGLARVFLAKGFMGAHIRHNYITSTSAQNNTRMLSSESWGSHVNGYDRGIYDGGLFTVRNGSTMNMYHYVDGVEYRWTAIKYE